MLLLWTAPYYVCQNCQNCTCCCVFNFLTHPKFNYILWRTRLDQQSPVRLHARSHTRSLMTINQLTRWESGKNVLLPSESDTIDRHIPDLITAVYFAPLSRVLSIGKSALLLTSRGGEGEFLNCVHACMHTYMLLNQHPHIRKATCVCMCAAQILWYLLGTTYNHPPASLLFNPSTSYPIFILHVCMCRERLGW